MKQALVLLGIIFAVVLAIVVGQRLSTEAMAVVVGVACGVAASVPVSLGLLLLLGRLGSLRTNRPEVESVRRRDTPPVVVMPGSTQPMWPGLGQLPPVSFEQFLQPPHVQIGIGMDVHQRCELVGYLLRTQEMLQRSAVAFFSPSVRWHKLGHASAQASLEGIL